ncbi:helix-turn-helix domain-containing protein [Enterococcus hirae]
MDFIVEKHFIRQLKIAQVLIDSPVPVPINELVSTINVVPNTLKSDLEELNGRMTPTWSFDIKEKKVCMKKPPDENYLSIYTKYLKDGFLYKFLLETFKSTKLNTIKLCETLLISHSHLYKKISLVQELLPQDVNINFSDLSLTGNEIKIRYIYFSLITLSQSPKDFCIFEGLINEARLIVKNIERDLDIEFPVYYKNAYNIWIAVCNRRAKYTIDLKNMYFKNPIYQLLKHNKKNWLLGEVSNNELQLLSIIWYVFPFPYFLKSNMISKLINYYEITYSSEFTMAKKIIDGGIDFSHANKYKLFLLLVVESLISLPIIETFTLIDNHIKQYKGRLLNTTVIERKISSVSIQNNHDYTKKQISILSHIISSHLIELTNQILESPIHIVVCSRYGFIEEQYLSNLINSKYPELVIAFPSTFSQNKQSDIIISDFLKNDTLNECFNKKEILCWENPVILRNWDELEYLLFKIIKKMLVK